MKKYLLLIFAAILALSACSGGPVQTAAPQTSAKQYDPYWPTEGWRTAPAEAMGMDADRLAEMLAYIDQQDWDIDSILIVRDGYVVTEKYYAPYSRDRSHTLYSVTKSFMSALIGIAIQNGFIEGVDLIVVDFFPDRKFDNLDPRKAEMTLQDLLTMRAGLAWVEGETAYRGLSVSPDAISYVLNLPMAAQPGTVFDYCSGCSHVLSGIIQETTGMDPLDYAQERLFEPLGISDVYWETDHSGLPIGGWGLMLTPRDMARFGYLYLQNGFWDGQQVVPEDWVRASVEAGREVAPGLDYGYQWWILPELNAFNASGLYGQEIYVIPDLDMVVVFTAHVLNPDFMDDLVEHWIIPAVQP
jgi:CubicO group peptidase (beta-lactamase class C family)